MEDLEALNANTTAFVIFLLILGALGILWTVFCSWLTGRKKRQRVANNTHGDEVALHVETPLTRAKGKSPDRYSAVEQVIILPIDDLGRSLHVPTIVITPPTPQDTPLDASSLPSDSSIGSADDLMRENQSSRDEIDYSGEVGDESESGGIESRIYAEGSMRNVLNGDPWNDTEKNATPQEGGSSDDLTFPISQTSWIDDGSGVASCSGRSHGGINCSMQINSPHYIVSVANVNNDDGKNGNHEFSMSDDIF